MNTATLRIAGIVLGSLALGCGSDDSGSKTATAVSCDGGFAPCGGSLTGSWSLGTLCVTSSVANALNALLVQYPSCPNTFTDGSLESSGSVSYTATDFTRNGTNHLTGKMKITAACFSDMTSGTPLTDVSCGSFAQVLPNRMTAPCVANKVACEVSVSCGYDGTTCNCDTNTTEHIDDSGTYTISGTTLTESTGATYQFCVNGSQLGESGVVGDGIAGVAYFNK